jgi:pyridoxine 4-dehydrogenase
VQNQYNLSDRRHEKVLKYCEQHNLAFIPWFPVAAGKLAQAWWPARQARCQKASGDVAQLSLAWLLTSLARDASPGTSSVKHLEENMQPNCTSSGRVEGD